MQRQQQQAEAKLTAEQSKTQQQVSQVSGEVTGVKTDLGGAKQDIASTRTDLDATKAKLEKAMGDLGIQSGLVARNHDELEMLKHKGDRNYFEFTLAKSQRQPVSTISMQLKKTDPKRSKFTLNLIADDRTIEKKDRTANEPLQFYTGRDRGLYEVVIYKVEKNSVTGYLERAEDHSTQGQLGRSGNLAALMPLSRCRVRGQIDFVGALRQASARSGSGLFQRSTSSQKASFSHSTSVVLSHSRLCQ